MRVEAPSRTQTPRRRASVALGGIELMEGFDPSSVLSILRSLISWPNQPKRKGESGIRQFGPEPLQLTAHFRWFSLSFTIPFFSFLSLGLWSVLFVVWESGRCLIGFRLPGTIYPLQATNCPSRTRKYWITFRGGIRSFFIKT